MDLQMFGGRGGRSSGGGGAKQAATAEDKAQAARERLGGRTVSATDLTNIPKDEMQHWLNNADVGTEIKGVYYKDSGNEVVIEKRGGYQPIYGGVGAGSRLYVEEWSVAGYEERFLASMLSKAADGTSKYYTLKKRR